MNLIEADAKALLARHGIAIPRGVLLGPTAEIPPPLADGVAVKAQVFSGGRGKAGLVRLCAGTEQAGVVASIRAALVALGHPAYLLIEERIEMACERYLAVRIDDVSQQVVIVFSPHGGMEVESAQGPAIFSVDAGRGLRADHLIAFFRSQGIEGKELGALCRFAAALYRVFLAEEAQLLEINPLAFTPSGQLVALDAKAVLDEEADFRHQDRRQLASHALAQHSRTALEVRAAEHQLTFVAMDGDIALLSGGAGNGMMVFDALTDAGYRPANFVDTIAGSGAARWQHLAELVFEHARQPHVRAIVAYFTLSVTPLRYLVDGLLGALASGPAPKPLVIGIVASGTAEAQLSLQDAQQILREAGLDCVVELPDLIARLQQTVPATDS